MQQTINKCCDKKIPVHVIMTTQVDATNKNSHHGKELEVEDLYVNCASKDEEINKVDQKLENASPNDQTITMSLAGSISLGIHLYHIVYPAIV